MQYREWWWGDAARAKLGDGPWSHEPDKIQFEDTESGYPCLMVRNRMGVWCGYVGVGPEHHLYEIDYSGCPNKCGENWCSHSPEAIFKVHGGITYSAHCQEGEGNHTICHVPEFGEPDHVWWFGFDTCHAGDKVPADKDYIPYQEYRDAQYVRDECLSLAAQLRALE